MIRVHEQDARSPRAVSGVTGPSAVSRRRAFWGLRRGRHHPQGGAGGREADAALAGFGDAGNVSGWARADLDRWLAWYNHDRPHQGRYNRGRPPLSVIRDFQPRQEIKAA